MCGYTCVNVMNIYRQKGTPFVTLTENSSAKGDFSPPLDSPSTLFAWFESKCRMSTVHKSASVRVSEGVDVFTCHPLEYVYTREENCRKIYNSNECLRFVFGKLCLSLHFGQKCFLVIRVRLLLLLCVNFARNAICFCYFFPVYFFRSLFTFLAHISLCILKKKEEECSFPSNVFAFFVLLRTTCVCPPEK